MSDPLVRPAVLDDAEAIAVVHHTSWVQTYSDLLPAEHWESDTVERRVQRWHERLSDGPGYLAVAVVDEQVVGFAKAGPTRRKKSVPSPVRSEELWALYVLGERHGPGSVRSCSRPSYRQLGPPSSGSPMPTHAPEGSTSSTASRPTVLGSPMTSTSP
jgi:hypothetical protein